MKLFHGTTADALKDILKNGLRTDKGGLNWNVSGENVYFWSPFHLIKRHECDKMDADEHAFQRAFESSQIGLGFAKDCRSVVLEIELNDKLLSEDDSCQNMEGAVYTCEDVPVSAIKSIKVSNDLALLKGYFLSFMLEREMSARELSTMEAKIATLFKDGKFYCEDLESLVVWRNVKLPKS